MPDSLKDFFFHKVTLRVIYIGAAFSTSHIVALIGSQNAQALFAKMGLIIKVADPHQLETYLTGVFLIAGEFLYEKFHKEVIMPKITLKEPANETSSSDSKPA